MADTVAGDVATSMANAQARYSAHLSATLGGPGVDIGAQVTLPPVPDNAVPASSSDLYPGAGDEPVPA
jgi:hypothetical protein